MKKFSATRWVFPFLILAGIWEAFAFVSNSSFFPHLHSVLRTLFESFRFDPIILAQGGGNFGYSKHVFITIQKFILCLVSGATSGFCLAITVFHWRRATKALSAVLEIWQLVPPLIVIPIALSIAGTSQLAQFIAGSVYAFVASIALTTGALQRIPDSYVALARLAGARRWWITRNVYSPVVLIESFGSLKLIGAFTLGIIIVLEYLAAPSGIGRVMKFAMSYHSIELLMVGVLWAILIGMSFDFAIDCLSRRFLRWTFRES